MIGGAGAIPDFAHEMIVRILQRPWHSPDSHPSPAHRDDHEWSRVYGSRIAVLSDRRDMGVQFVRADLRI